jgi:hypothetical protein
MSWNYGGANRLTRIPRVRKSYKNQSLIEYDIRCRWAYTGGGQNVSYAVARQRSPGTARDVPSGGTGQTVARGKIDLQYARSGTTGGCAALM